MARSSAVYVVVPPSARVPLAGFTVKHEMVTWLQRTGIRQGDWIEVWRLTDNPCTLKEYPSKPPTRMTIRWSESGEVEGVDL